MTRKIITFFGLLFLAVLASELLSQAEAFAQYVDTAWVRRYNGPGNATDGANAIAVDGYGNVYVTGESYGSGTSYDYATIKYYPNGDTAWLRRYNGATNLDDYAEAIVVDGSGNVYVTGIVDDAGYINMAERSDSIPNLYDYGTIKYYPNGDTAWVRKYSGPENSIDHAYAIAIDSSGNVYVTGASSDSGTAYDYTTIKYFSNGDTAWLRRYNGSGNLNDGAYSIAVDNLGNVYVTGYSRGSGTSDDYATIKYYANGDTAWVRRYNGPGYSFDRAIALAVDAYYNVYVTGYSRDSGTYDDYATIKYYSNGDTAWVRRYNGSDGMSDFARAIAVDSSGNVYVTGESGTITEDHDYATIKYYPNGDTAWVRRYNRTAYGNDYAKALAVDGFGNVYVTGYSQGSGTSDDYATIKYYANGDTAWVRRYNGPANGVDQAWALALDDTISVYVTGSSYGSGTGDDYVTIKYIQFQTRNDTLYFLAYSPVDLIVTDPLGRWIDKDSTLIPNAAYDDTTDLDGDGDKDDKVTIPKPLLGEYQVKVIRTSGPLTDTSYTLGIRIDGSDETPLVTNSVVPAPGEVDTFYYSVTEYLRGDPNKDGKTSISDIVFLINYLFKGGPPSDPLFLGDANYCIEGREWVSISDVVYLGKYLFSGGNAPCS